MRFGLEASIGLIVTMTIGCLTSSLGAMAGTLILSHARLDTRTHGRRVREEQDMLRGCAVPVAASDIAITNAEYSNANAAITMADTFVPQAGVAYDIFVNLAVPTTTSGFTSTIGGLYVYNSRGNYKRFPELRSPFVLRVMYLGDPEHYNFISMRPFIWTLRD